MARICRICGLEPHRNEPFKLPNDPLRIQKSGARTTDTGQQPMQSVNG